MYRYNKCLNVRGFYENIIIVLNEFETLVRKGLIGTYMCKKECLNYYIPFGNATL